MSEFAEEPVERPAEHGAGFVLLRFLGGFAALTGGSGLGLLLSGAYCPATVSGAAWATTAWVAIILAGLSAAVGAWWPRVACRVAAAWLVAGLVAAPFAVELQRGVERGRLKRTMGDIRALASALETKRREAELLPRTMRGLERLADESEPKLGLEDAWGTPFRFERDGESWLVTAACRCGRFDAARWSEYESGRLDDLRSDLMFRDDRFLRYPGAGNSASSARAQEPPPR
jgi:hypothetical protein